MSRHILEREQFLPIAIEEAWELFSDPRNLARITPPELGFVIHGNIGEKMVAGQRITYTVRPLFGIPLSWVTLIEDVHEPHGFVDTQLKGPYKYWHHRHSFFASEGGTLMKDRVEYELPFGPVGELAHVLLVKNRLKKIFDHRYATLEAMFVKVENVKV